MAGDGVVTGWGTINGRKTFVFAQDFTVFGGSLSETHAQKITKVQEMAMRHGAPIIGLQDSGGARIQEGVAALAGYTMFSRIDRIDESLDTLVPDNPNLPYDMKELVHKIADEGDFFEIQADFAKNILCGFIRLEGQTVGVVANQPMVLAGCLDSDASRGGNPAPQRFGRCRENRRTCRRLRREVPQPIPRGRTRIYRRSHPAALDPQTDLPRLSTGEG